MPVTKCGVCGKKLTNKDYYKLCVKCHKAWHRGYNHAKTQLIYDFMYYLKTIGYPHGYFKQGEEL